MTFPFLLMTLHLSHIGLTDGLTFIFYSSENFLRAFRSFGRAKRLIRMFGARAFSCMPARSGKAGAKNVHPIVSVQFLLRQVIRPLVKSYGLISSFTVSPGMIRI